MARVVFVCVVMLSVLAGCFAKELSLLDLLRTLSDDRDDDLAEKAFDISDLKTVATTSTDDLKEAVTTLLPILKTTYGQSTQARKTQLTPICKELVGQYEDRRSDLRKAFKKFEDAFKSVKTKLGETRSFDMRIELRADLDLMDALDSSLDRRTSNDLSEAQIIGLRKQIQQALNNIGKSGDEAIKSTEDKGNLGKIKAELGNLFVPATKLENMFGLFKAQCEGDGLSIKTN